jgi:lysophospholipase L1-like esterase
VFFCVFRGQKFSPISLFFFPMISASSLPRATLALLALIATEVPTSLSAATPSTAAVEALVPVKVADFVPIGAQNLASFAAKVRTRQPVVIGFLGGSITVGAGASSGQAYRTVTQRLLTAEIERRGSKVSSRVSATGGTGSGFGVYRVGRELLEPPVDLIVVEYAVNNFTQVQKGPAGVASAVDSMDAIVRQALRANPAIGLVFFSTSQVVQQEGFYNQGLISPSVLAHHRVAAHYGIMEVIIGPTITRELVAGKFTLEQFFPDKTHPSDIGHGLYGKLLAEAIISALDQAPAKPSPVPPRLGTGVLEYARMDLVPPGNSGWTLKEKGNGSLICDRVGLPLHFTVKGAQPALVYNGRLKVTWSSGGQAHEKILTGVVGRPSPTSWAFPADAQPDATGVSVEALAGDDGLFKTQVLGVTSIQAP